MNAVPCTPHADPTNAYKCQHHPKWPWHGHLCPAHQREADYPKELTDAWKIIQTLHSERLDAGESWPRALAWLERNIAMAPKAPPSLVELPENPVMVTITHGPAKLPSPYPVPRHPA